MTLHSLTPAAPAGASAFFAAAPTSSAKVGPNAADSAKSAADATYANKLLLARQLKVRLAAEHLAEHQNPATSAPTVGETLGTQFSANA